MGATRREELIAELEAARGRRASAIATERAELSIIATLAREAVLSEDVPLAEVARLAGVSRPTLYSLIHSKPSGRSSGKPGRAKR
jgi:hypothetical protein